MGLRPFREVPRDLEEWTRWFNAQDVVSADDIEQTTTVQQTVEQIIDGGIQLWTIKEFAVSYTPVAEDADNVLLVSTAATGVTVTIDPVFDVGSQLTIYQYGAGQVTLAGGTGVTIRTPTNLTINEQYGTVTLIEYLNNDWVIAGRMTP